MNSADTNTKQAQMKLKSGQAELKKKQSELKKTEKEYKKDSDNLAAVEKSKAKLEVQYQAYTKSEFHLLTAFNVSACSAWLRVCENCMPYLSLRLLQVSYFERAKIIIN